MHGVRRVMCHGEGMVLIGESDLGGDRLVVQVMLSLLLNICHYLVQAGQLLLFVSWKETSTITTVQLAYT